MSDRIELRDFSLQCIVGLLEREQAQPQRLDVELALELDLDGAAGGDLSASVDYAAVAEQVRFIAQAGRWYLLESLAAALCAHLLEPPAPGEARAPIDAVQLALRKPEILGDVATPAVVVRREAGWRTLPRFSPSPGVEVRVLQETPRSGAYRVQVEPDAQLVLPGGAASHPIAQSDNEGACLLVVSRPVWARP